MCTNLPANSVGLKLTKDPIDWRETAAVFEKYSFSSQNWDLITKRNLRGSRTKENNFYVLNGKAYQLDQQNHDDGAKKAKICIMPATQPMNASICLYFREDNPSLEDVGDFELSIRSRCSGTKLNARNCFGVEDTKQCKGLGNSYLLLTQFNSVNPIYQQIYHRRFFSLQLNVAYLVGSQDGPEKRDAQFERRVNRGELSETSL